MRKSYLFFLIMILTSSVLFSQNNTRSYLGFKAGGVYSGINNISEMFYPEDHFDPSTFSTDTKNVWGGMVGVYFNWTPIDEELIFSFSIQPEATFTMQGAKFFYKDNQDFNCELDFKYNYVSAGLIFRGDVLLGGNPRGYKNVSKAGANVLSLHAGPRIGFNISPENISYSSNNQRFGDDEDISQAYRNVLKGRPDFSLGVGLSFSLFFGLGIEAMYYFGLSDVIETQVNNYDFVDNSNRSNLLQLSLTYNLNLGKR